MRILDATTRTACNAATTRQGQSEALIAAFAGGDVRKRYYNAAGTHLCTTTIPPFTINSNDARGVVEASTTTAYTFIVGGTQARMVYAVPDGADIFEVDCTINGGAGSVDFPGGGNGGEIKELCPPTAGGVVVFTPQTSLPVTAFPSYVPATIGEAAIITSTNSLQSVQPALTGVGSTMQLGDFSGGAVSQWFGSYGAHLIHGQGHAAGENAGVYGKVFGPSSVSWQRFATFPDLSGEGAFVDYSVGGYSAPIRDDLGTSFGYYVTYGASSTLPTDPLNAAGWSSTDDEASNPREVRPFWPGAEHTYGSLVVLSPEHGGDAQGTFVRHTGFAISRTASRSTRYSHARGLSLADSVQWERWGPAAGVYKCVSYDTLRGQIKPFNSRGYTDATDGSWVADSGSITGLPSSYFDNRIACYHAARDVHVFVGQTEASAQAGDPAGWVWWAAGSDSGARTTITWAGGVTPPAMVRTTPGISGESSLSYCGPLEQFIYYSRADEDALWFITPAATLTDAWTATRLAMTGSGKPSDYGSRASHVYGRAGYVPALKSWHYEPLTSDTGETINRSILVRVVS